MHKYVLLLYRGFLQYHIRDHAWCWVDRYTKEELRFADHTTRACYFGPYAKYLIEE